MNFKWLENYTKEGKIIIRVLSVLFSVITLFTSVVPGWFAKKYGALPPDTGVFSTVPIDTDPGAPHITLAKDGSSDYVIIYGKNANFAETTAATELSDYLYKISGARIDVFTDERSPEAKEIVVGKTNRESAYTIDRGDLGDDGFAIKVADEKLVIAGGEKRGTLYGVYTFLEDYLGCRWYSKDFELVPTINKITVKLSVDETQKPAFTFRDSYWDCTHDPVYRAKVKLNGIFVNNPIKPMGPYIDVLECAGYSFEGIISGANYFADHPEYFFVDSTGQRNPGQLCLTNPEVIEILKNYICSSVANLPEKDIFTLFTNDSADYCLCDACRAVNSAEGTSAGTLIRAVNEIAREIYAIRPEVSFRTLIGEGSLTPPAITKLEKNVAVQLCSIGCNMAKPYTEGSPTFCQFVKNWAALGCEFSVWDYNINYTNFSAPYPNISYIDDNIRFMAENNVKGYFMLGSAYGPSGEFGELRAYIVSKMLWNPNCDIEAIKEEFLRAYYGAGYENIIEYIKLTEANSTGNFDIISDPDKMLVLNEAQAAQCDAWWDAAEAAAKNDDELARIQKSRIQLRYYKSEMRLGEFSRLKSMWRVWDEGEKLYDDMQRFGVTYICQERALKDRDKLFFIQNANEWKK
jgi:hypothetical protein